MAKAAPRKTEPPAWSTACPDWERRIVAGESLIPFEPLFPDQAEQAMTVFSSLVMVDAGNRTLGEISRQWVFDFVKAIFGSYDAETGRRLIVEFLLLISKKNGKSSDAAGIMLTALVLNWRYSGEYYVLAPTKEVADNSFIPARDAIKAHPDLSALFHVQDNLRKITHRQTGAFVKVVAADSETVSGKKTIGLLVDELWLFGKNPKAKNMLREAQGGIASRPEGFVIYLTTQSDEPPQGVFKEKLDYARAVRDGEIVDPKFLPVLYEFPKHMLEAEEHKRPENFYITNPNLGASVDMEYLTREYAKAEREGKESLNGFMAKHLNVEIGQNTRLDRWIGAEFWPGAKCEHVVTLDSIIEQCEVITVGVDGGGLDDLLGATFLGRVTNSNRDGRGGVWLSYSRAWVHRIGLDRRKSEVAKYEDLVREGTLRVVEEVGQDVAELCDMIMQIEESGLLDKVGVDPAGIGAVVDALNEAGLEFERIVQVPQGWKLNGAIKTVERRLAARQLQHDGSQLMAYCVGNARTELRGNATTVSKAVSGSAKIDPLVALFCAAVLMLLNPQPRKKQYQMFVI